MNRLKKILEDAYGHVAAAELQSIPSDDQIIAGHVRDAGWPAQGRYVPACVRLKSRIGATRWRRRGRNERNTAGPGHPAISRRPQELQRYQRTSEALNQEIKYWAADYLHGKERQDARVHHAQKADAHWKAAADLFKEKE